MVLRPDYKCALTLFWRRQICLVSMLTVSVAIIRLAVRVSLFAAAVRDVRPVVRTATLGLHTCILRIRFPHQHIFVHFLLFSTVRRRSHQRTLIIKLWLLSLADPLIRQFLRLLRRVHGCLVLLWVPRPVYIRKEGGWGWGPMLLLLLSVMLPLVCRRGVFFRTNTRRGWDILIGANLNALHEVLGSFAFTFSFTVCRIHSIICIPEYFGRILRLCGEYAGW